MIALPFSSLPVSKFSLTRQCVKLNINYCKSKRFPGATIIPAPSRGRVPVKTGLEIGNLPAYHPDGNRKDSREAGHSRQSDTGINRQTRGPRSRQQNHKLSRQQQGQTLKIHTSIVWLL